MKKKMLNKILAGMIALSVIFQGMTFPAFAEENVSEDGEISEEAIEEIPFEGEDMVDDGLGNNEIVMSGSVASNGMTIAASFPDSFIPDGFYAEEVTHEDGRIELLRLNNDPKGAVVLTYLAQADGTNGDFFFYDADTGAVSDYLMIKNGEHFLVVLDTADQIVAPAGFVKAAIKKNGKNVNGWVIASNAGASDSASSMIQNPFAPVEVYAAGAGDLLGGGIGQDTADYVGNEENEAVEDTDNGEEANQEDSFKSDAVPGNTDDSDYTAPTSDFFLVYAIDDEGYVGFFLCDKERDNSFLRYTVVSNGAPVLNGLQANANLLCIILIILAILLLIAIFIIINMIIARREDDYDEDDDEDDEDDELDSLRKKVAGRNPRGNIDPREQRYQMGEELEDEILITPSQVQPVRRRPDASQGMQQGNPQMRQQPVRRHPDMPQGNPQGNLQGNPEMRQQPVRRHPDMPQGNLQGNPEMRQQPVRRRPMPTDGEGEGMKRPQQPVRRRPMPNDGEGEGMKRPQQPVRRHADMPQGNPQGNPEMRQPQRRHPGQQAPVQRRRPVPQPEQNYDTDFNFEFIDNE